MSNHSVFFLEPSKLPVTYEWTGRGVPDGFRNYMPTHCAYADCSEKSTYMDTPLCRAHAAIVWRLFETREPATHHDIIRQQYQEAKQERAATAERIRLDSKRPGFVYYVRVGDRIKIGFTSCIEDRMKAYPPHSELLAYHPGTLELEKSMHSKFRVLLSEGREWFKPGEKLMAHIKDVSRQFPLPGDDRPGPLAPHAYAKPSWATAPKPLRVA